MLNICFESENGLSIFTFCKGRVMHGAEALKYIQSFICDTKLSKQTGNPSCVTGLVTESISKSQSRRLSSLYIRANNFVLEYTYFQESEAFIVSEMEKFIVICGLSVLCLIGKSTKQVLEVFSQSLPVESSLYVHRPVHTGYSYWNECEFEAMILIFFQGRHLAQNATQNGALYVASMRHLAVWATATTWRRMDTSQNSVSSMFGGP